MINFSRFTLDNGLRVLVNEDRSTPLVAVNLLYNVGSRDEDPKATGLAHLFEHLMFGGSVNIPDYDTPLQLVGGENNAFTNNDITNYYLTIPSANIETAFWLESDRMLGLDFSQKNLDTQKNVVIEEFRQRYMNQPYGDAMLHMRPLAYKVHPYRWTAIGMDTAHVENTSLEHIKSFFYSHYAPNNAILSVSGNIDHDTVLSLAEKWFGTIGKREIAQRTLPDEPPQTEARVLNLERKVPNDAIYKAWHIGPRNRDDFHTFDLVTDILAGGESGRLYSKLVREKRIFSEINAFITSDIDPGLLFVTGRLMKGVSLDVADNEIVYLIDELKSGKVLDDEIQKVKYKFEASTVFGRTNILNKAMNIAYFELLGDASMINNETEKYNAVTTSMIAGSASEYLNPSNCSTIYYRAETPVII